MRRIPTLVCAAGALVAMAAGPVASQGGGGGGQPASITPAPPIAQIVDVPPGGGGQPIKAIWRDTVVSGRLHMVLDSAVEPGPWRILHTTEGWAPRDVRLELTFDANGVPQGQVSASDSDTSLGTAAALLETNGFTLEVPGIAGPGAHLRTSARNITDENAIDLVLGPIAIDAFTAVPADGLRSPAEVVLYGTDDAPTLAPTRAPQGPAVRRTNAGVRITLPDPIPTTANGQSVTTVTDRVLVRGQDSLTAPIVASLLVTAEGVTVVDGVGQQLPSVDNPWQVAFTAVEGGVPTAEVSFTELGEMLGAPLTGSTRLGMLRVLDLGDGTRLIGDGLDVRVDALPSVATATDDTADDEAAAGDDTSDNQPAWRTILPVLIGIAVVGAVLAPGIWFRVQDRRLRRHRDTSAS